MLRIQAARARAASRPAERIDFGTAPSTAISDRIRRNCRALKPSGLPKSPSPTSRHATVCNAARVSTSDSAMRRRSRQSSLDAGVDSVMTAPSTKSITTTGTSSSSPAAAVANTRGAGTRVRDNASSSRASRSTSWAPGGNGGGGGRRTTTRECAVRHHERQIGMAVADRVGGHRRAHRPRSARIVHPAVRARSADHVHITCPWLERYAR